MELPHIVHLPEKIVYKLPEGDCVYVAQPYGKQCYAWFTQTSAGPTCILIDRRTKKQWNIPIEFDPSLCGTLFYGTVIYYESTRIFLMDDIFYSKQEKVNLPYLKKCDLFVELMTFIKHTTSCLFMLPLISTTLVDFDPIYKMYSTKLVFPTMIYHYMDQKKTAIYTVRSTPKSDIYELYTNQQLQSIAYIDTYKRSEFMNTIFHPTDEYKESERKMECLWHEPFKKWIPFKLTEAMTS